MWTEATRTKYERRTGRYASDVTDEERALIEPFLPLPGTIGRPRTTDLREVVSALFDMAATGCPGSFRPIRRFRAISTAGATKGSGLRSTTIW